MYRGVLIPGPKDFEKSEPRMYVFVIVLVPGCALVLVFCYSCMHISLEFLRGALCLLLHLVCFAFLFCFCFLVCVYACTCTSRIFCVL